MYSDELFECTGDESIKMDAYIAVQKMYSKWMGNLNISDIDQIPRMEEILFRAGTLCNAIEFWKFAYMFNSLLRKWDEELRPVRTKFMAEIAPGIHAVVARN